MKEINKKRLFRAFLVIVMFILAVGSVVVSCTSLPGDREKGTISLNVGSDTKGEIYTTWVLDRLDSVLLVDMNDRTRKIELSPEEWRYDPETTQLIIDRTIPFNDSIASIRGQARIPHGFVLRNLTDKESLMVVLDDRLAIEGYDFRFDLDNNRLLFRDDIALNERQWLIRYDTHGGGASIGDWKPENRDRLSYLEAEHRRRYLSTWFDRQESFWFLERASEEGEKPILVKRAPTDDELRVMKSSSAFILKMRGESSFAELSRELGFSIKLPDRVYVEDVNREYVVFHKDIEEWSFNGDIFRKLNVYYRLEVEDGFTSGVTVVLYPDGTVLPAEDAGEDKRLIISDDTVEMGVPVHSVREWGTRTSGALDAKPDIVTLISWEWSDGPVRYSLRCDSSREEEYKAFIRSLIDAVD